MLSVPICLPPASGMFVCQNLVSFLLLLEVRKGSDKNIKGMRNKTLEERSQELQKVSQRGEGKRVAC